MVSIPEADRVAGHPGHLYRFAFSWLPFLLFHPPSPTPPTHTHTHMNPPASSPCITADTHQMTVSPVPSQGRAGHLVAPFSVMPSDERILEAAEVHLHPEGHAKLALELVTVFQLLGCGGKLFPYWAPFSDPSPTRLLSHLTCGLQTRRKQCVTLSASVCSVQNSAALTRPPK
jgi:hypothetical protein